MDYACKSQAARSEVLQWLNEAAQASQDADVHKK